MTAIPSIQTPFVALLAGGQSRRFGSDKALVRIGEQTLLEHMLGRIEEAGMPTAVIGRKAGATDSWLGIPDRKPDAGPAEGLACALAHARNAGHMQVILLAVDLPLMSARSLHWLAGLPDAEAIVPALDGRAQYCAARYHVSAFDRIEANLAQDKHSLHQQVASLNSRTAEIPPKLAADFAGFNTQAELDDLINKGLIHG